MGYGRTNSGGGITLPNGYKKVELYGAAANQMFPKNSLGICLAGTETVNNQTQYYLTPKNAFQPMKEYAQEEGISYAGFVYRAIWNEKYNKGMMIRLGNSNTQMYATIFEYAFDENDPIDNNQFNVQFLRNALITSSFSNYAYLSKAMDLYKISETEDTTNFLLLYGGNTSWSGTYGVNFAYITINWNTNSFSIKDLTNPFAFYYNQGCTDFFSYKVVNEDKIVLVFGNNSSVREVANVTSGSVSSYYITASFDAVAETVTAVKGRTELRTAAYGQSFAFIQLGKKFAVFCRNPNDSGDQLIFYSLGTDGTLTEGKTVTVEVGRTDANTYFRGMTFKYDVQANTAIIGVAKNYSMHMYVGVYNVDVANEAMSFVCNLQNPFETYVNTIILQDFSHGQPFGHIEFMVCRDSYAASISAGYTAFNTSDLTQFAIRSIKFNATNSGYLSGVVFRNKIGNGGDFYVGLGIQETSNFTLGVKIYRKNAYLQYKAPLTNSSISSYPNPSIILEDMSKWKKGVAVIPSNWVVYELQED